MKKKIILSLALAMCLLTGCGKESGAEKILADVDIGDAILTEAQLVKAQEKEKTPEVSCVKSAYATEQGEKLVEMFDKLRQMGFERQYYEYEAKNVSAIDSDEELSDADKHALDMDIMENPSKYLSSENYNSLSRVFTYFQEVAADSASELKEKVEPIYNMLSAYGVTDCEEFFAKMHTGDYMSLRQNGISVELEGVEGDESNEITKLTIEVSVVASRLYVPEDYQNLINSVTGSYYDVDGFSTGPLTRILFSSGEGVNPNDPDYFSPSILLNMQGQKVIQVDIDIDVTGKFAKKHKVTMSDATKETVKTCLKELMGDEKLVEEFVAKMEDSLTYSGEIGDYNWKIEGDALSVYHA